MTSSDRKTTPNGEDARAFLDGVSNAQRREDAIRALDLMAEITGAPPRMWGTSIIGFGRQPYATADGKTREWFAVGLSPRSAALTLYGLTYDGANEDLLAALGPHTTGKGCLYIKRLDKVDEATLRELIARAWRDNHVPA